MGKLQKEACRTLSIYDFRRWGCLNGYSSGVVTWTNGWGKKNSIGYALRVAENREESCLRLNYTVTDNQTGEKKDISNTYPVVSLPCRYGGKRYFFRCSAWKSGVYCGRRVAKLYMGGGCSYFACRHCLDLTYDSRICGYAYTVPDLEESEKKIGRYFYRGKPTRKYRAYLKKEQSFEWSLFRLGARLGCLPKDLEV